MNKVASSITSWGWGAGREVEGMTGLQYTCKENLRQSEIFGKVCKNHEHFMLERENISFSETVHFYHELQFYGNIPTKV